MTDNEKRLMSEAIEAGFRFSREAAEAKEKAAMWKAAFFELLDYHFAEGGTSPNLRFDRINGKFDVADIAGRYDVRNNGDHLTMVRKECWL